MSSGKTDSPGGLPVTMSTEVERFGGRPLLSAGPGSRAARERTSEFVERVAEPGAVSRPGRQPRLPGPDPQGPSGTDTLGYRIHWAAARVPHLAHRVPEVPGTARDAASCCIGPACCAPVGTLIDGCSRQAKAWSTRPWLHDAQATRHLCPDPARSCNQGRPDASWKVPRVRQ